MDENAKAGEAPGAAEEQGNIMQGIQDMIGNLLQNAIGNMQQREMSKQMGGGEQAATGEGENSLMSAQMNIAEIKQFVYAMQRFLDNVNAMIAQIESGGPSTFTSEDGFLEDYMNTADNILEIAAFSTKDNLTGLLNRYGFENRMVLEWNRAVREKTPLSLLIFSVDGYSYRDESMDPALRDTAFKAISGTLERSIKRATDFLARWSNDEFAALLPITDIGGASVVAERIRAEIAAASIPGRAGGAEGATVCVGISVTVPVLNEQPAGFIEKACAAIAKARESGGNLIVTG